MQQWLPMLNCSHAGVAQKPAVAQVTYERRPTGWGWEPTRWAVTAERAKRERAQEERAQLERARRRWTRSRANGRVRKPQCGGKGGRPRSLLASFIASCGGSLILPAASCTRPWVEEITPSFATGCGWLRRRPTGTSPASWRASCAARGRTIGAAEAPTEWATLARYTASGRVRRLVRERPEVVDLEVARAARAEAQDAQPAQRALES